MKKKNPYRNKVFKEYYVKRWESIGKTAQEFADAVNKEIDNSGKDGNCDKRYVSGWKTGTQGIGSLYFDAICKVLGMDRNQFEPDTHDEKYKLLSSFQDEIQRQHTEKAEKDFNLNISLLIGLKQLIDFDKLFPLYSPLIGERLYSDTEIILSEMHRMPFAEAAKGGGDRLFQINRDGKTITLSYYDMKYLKAIQEMIVEFAKKEFQNHKYELIEAAEKAKEIHIPADPDGVFLNPESKLQEIDPWGIYTEKEKRKYKLTESD